VFIKQGLDHLQETKKSRIHEVGFGTGLNALLAMRWAEEHQVHVHFTTLETNVLSLELAGQLNYASSEQERSVFLNMHAAPWNQDIVITPHFTLHKALREVQSEVSEAQFDVIFFDAFDTRYFPTHVQLSQARRHSRHLLCERTSATRHAISWLQR